MESGEKSREELLSSNDRLQWENDRLYGMMERISDGFVAFDLNFNYTYVNSKGAELLGREADELIGKNYWLEYPEARETPFARAYVRAMETQEPIRLEAFYEHWNRWFINRIYPSNEGITIFFTDITDQKLAEIEFRESKNLLKSIIDSTTDMIWSVDSENFGLVNWNSSFEEHFNKDRRIQIKAGMNPADLFEGNEKFTNLWFNLFRRAIEKGSFSVEYESFHGTKIAVLNINPLFQEGKITGISVFANDITKLKQTESSLSRINRLYSVVSQVSQTIVRYKDRDQLFEEVCRIAIEFGKFRMAWVGLVDETTQAIVPVAHAGYEAGYLAAIKQITAMDQPEGHGPTGMAVREGRAFVCANYATDPHVEIWRKEALSRGYCSSIALPVILSGKAVGVLNLYASIPDFFDKQEVELLLEIVHDLSFALDAIETQKKHEQAEMALAKSEDRFRGIFNKLQDAFLQIDVAGILTMVSPSAVRMFGYQSAEEMLGLQVLRLYAFEEERELMLKALKANGSVSDHVALAKRKDGSVFWISMNVQLLYNDGVVSGSEGLIRDISARKTDEDKIHTFSSIMEQSPVSVVITDINGNIEYVNPKFSKITGYSQEESIGHNPRILKSSTKSSSEYREMWETISSGKEWHGEFLNIKKSGEEYYESATISAVFDANNNISHYIAVKEDITERKKNEDQIKMLSAVVEQSPSMIIITDKGGLIEYVNTKFSTFSQYSPADIIGRTPLIFNRKYHTSDTYARMWETIESGDIWQSEFKNRKKDGTSFWGYITAFPLTSEMGQIQNYIIIIDDITDKKQLVDDLIRSKEKAEESDRLKSAFLANMSHEIRTPMNGILGFSGLLKEPNLDGNEQQFYIKLIEESGNRMLNLMNNLIDISRIESGEVKIVISAFEITKKFEYLFDFFNREAKQKGLRLIYHLNLAPEETMIRTDVQKLDAVLDNLLKNAIKFTRTGTIEFGVEKQDNCFRFFVKDSGVGIDPGHHKLIFDRFRQASESLSRPYEGAGLGLSIAGAYVELLGGRMWVESDIGKGAVFYFTIPDGTNKEQEFYARLNSAPVPGEDIPKEPRLLLVEDDDVSMNYMEIIAEKLCTEIYKANTGAEAIEIFRNNQNINIIMMDIKLPVMDGLEATRKIREFNSEVIIIAQTAYSMVGDKEKAIAAGCNDYITKPIERKKLEALIQVHMQG